MAEPPTTVKVEDAALRSFATGLSQGANNLLGFAMGSLAAKHIPPIGEKSVPFMWGSSQDGRTRQFIDLHVFCLMALVTCLFLESCIY